MAASRGASLAVVCGLLSAEVCLLAQHGLQASAAAARGLKGTGSVTCCSTAPGYLPGLEIEPASPSPAGGFFTTGPPGKPLHSFSLESRQASDTKGRNPKPAGLFFPGQVEREFQPGRTHSSPPPAVWPQGHCSDRLARWLSGNQPACRARDTGVLGSIPGSGRSPGGGHGHPVRYLFLPGESQGRRSLVGCSPWGRRDSGRTE